MTRKTFRGRSLMLAGVLPLGLAVHAQTASAQTAPTPPTAGQLLRDAQPPQRPAPRNDAGALPAPAEARPPLNLPAGRKVHVSAVEITGAQTQPLPELQALVADAVGQDLDFAGLQALAERITAHYRRAGYVLARAYLPSQHVDGGRIEVAVLEGRLGQIKLSAEPPLPQDALAARLTRMQAGQPLRSDALEGDLLGLSDLPGIRVQSVLRPGQSVGTSDLDIQVLPGDRVNGSLTADNYGNRYSGAERLSGRVGVASPFLFGDSLDASAVYAGGGYQYVRLAWQAPLGASGWQAGLAQSAMHYRLGEEFESLNASGNASDTTLYALKSLQRSRASNLDLNLAFDHKHYDDAASGSTATKHADVGSASLAGRWQGLGGNTSGTLGATAGRVDLGAANAATDAAGHHTQGHYAKITWQAGQDQPVPGGGFNLRLSGQLAAKNLDSSEKLALGGAQAVRAYPQGEASSDDALMANAEAYRDFDGWRAKLFADLATGRAWHSPITSDTDNRKTLAGVGVGADATLPGQIALQAVAALRIGRVPTSDVDRRPRVWVQLSKSF